MLIPPAQLLEAFKAPSLASLKIKLVAAGVDHFDVGTGKARSICTTMACLDAALLGRVGAKASKPALKMHGSPHAKEAEAG